MAAQALQLGPRTAHPPGRPPYLIFVKCYPRAMFISSIRVWWFVNEMASYNKAVARIEMICHIFVRSPPQLLLLSAPESLHDSIFLSFFSFALLRMCVRRAVCNPIWQICDVISLLIQTEANSAKYSLNQIISHAPTTTSFLLRFQNQK